MSVMLTIREVAGRIGVPETTLKNWIYRDNRFPKPDRVVAKQRAGRLGEWTAETVRKWEEGNAAR